MNSENLDQQEYWLAIDVGNSRIKFGLFNKTDSLTQQEELPVCLESLAVPVKEDIPWKTIQEWESKFNASKVTSFLAGSNPQVQDKLVKEWNISNWNKPTRITDLHGKVIEVGLPFPEKVGVDRLLNAIAVNRIRKENQPAIVISSGTATTVDYVSETGQFSGGSIFPGFEMMALSLNLYTSLLPLISLDNLKNEEHHALGKNTSEALHSGLFWAQSGAVKELIRQLQKLSENETAVYLTGGGAEILYQELTTVELIKDLSLQGLIIAVCQDVK